VDGSEGARPNRRILGPPEADNRVQEAPASSVLKIVRGVARTPSRKRVEEEAAATSVGAGPVADRPIRVQGSPGPSLWKRSVDATVHNRSGSSGDTASEAAVRAAYPALRRCQVAPPSSLR
jgi:cell division septation protein DedD